MPPKQIANYRIVEKLGEGGMGVVYRAEDEILHRSVAIKLLPHELKKDAKAVERFHREARIASALRHPHICTVYDFGDFAGVPYMVMELLDGKTLRDTLNGRPLELDRLLEIAIQVADALDAAHETGIVHRDIKSTNIFVADNGAAKVLDFGLAKLAEHASAGLSVALGQLNLVSLPGLTIGTATHMSPEQVAGKELDRRSDLFSLGVVLYEMATGLLPFQGSNSLMIMQSILSRPFARPSQINPGLPHEFDRIIRKVLEKERSLRYQSAADLKTDLLCLRRDIGLGRTQTEGWPMPVDDNLPLSTPVAHLRFALIAPWDAVARDGRDFGERASGMMYWYRVPLSSVAYPVGFRSNLQPALENPRVTKIRFLLDANNPAVVQLWPRLVIPLILHWANRKRRSLQLEEETDRGRFYDIVTGRPLLSWAFTPLGNESAPSCKLCIDDHSESITGMNEAEIFIATAARSVRLLDGSQETMHIPDTILRTGHAADSELMLTLSRVVGRWDYLFL